jgi:hypothetical protein
MKINVSIELTRPAWLPKRLSRRGLAVLLVFVLTLGVPGTALANHLFADVPTSSIFHDAISAIAGAGITTGCGGGNYCPTANVTREQMAAFLHRGLGRVASTPGAPPEIAVTVTPVLLRTLTIQPGEVTGSTVLVKLDTAYTTYLTSTTGCPCSVRFFQVYGTTPGSPRVGTNTYAMLTVLAGSFAIQSGPLTGTVAVPSGADATFTVWAEIFGGTGNATLRAWADMSAVYAPFGSQGTSAP